MVSRIAVSYEVDDTALAVRQLHETILDNFTPLAHSIGLLFCDADADGAALTGELSRLLGFDIAGLTTLAPFTPKGREEASIVLSVLSADDCTFAAAASVPLGKADYGQGILDVYNRVAPDAAPALMFAFCPCGAGFSADSYPDILTAASHGTPVFGGVASDDYDYKRARVFLSGEEYYNAMALVGVFGNAHPVFALRHVTTRLAERTQRVTKAVGNVVYRVGDESFVEYLEGFGLKTEVEDPLLAFTSYPMVLTHDGENSDEVPLMRHIHGIDRESGAGEFLGDIPEGTLANICLISKQNVVSACRESMELLLENAREASGGANAGDPGYQYSMIFCISCGGRAIILGQDSNAEGDVLAEMLPAGLSLSGAYCLGEICPTKYRNGVATNRFHNCSIIFCMV